MATNRLIVKEQIATYTSLLFEAVKNEGGSEGVLRLSNEAKQIVAAIRGNADLDAALKDPGFTPEQKATLARNVFADANPALVSVIALMAERDELDYLPRVADGIEERMKDELNIVLAARARAKAFDLMTFVFGALLIAFAFMGVATAPLLLLVFAYLFVHGSAIYYRAKLEKEM